MDYFEQIIICLRASVCLCERVLVDTSGLANLWAEVYCVEELGMKTPGSWGFALHAAVEAVELFISNRIFVRVWLINKPLNVECVYLIWKREWMVKCRPWPERRSARGEGGRRDAKAVDTRRDVSYWFSPLPTPGYRRRRARPCPPLSPTRTSARTTFFVYLVTYIFLVAVVVVVDVAK